MRNLSEALDQRVLLTDGSAVRQLRAHKLDLERDLYGAAEYISLLNLTRAPLVRAAHIGYLEAGADVIRTNTLESSPLSLQRYGLGDEAFYINYSAAQIACEAVDSVPGQGRRRFVLGVVRDQGWDVAPGIIDQAVATQIEGLLAGGVDGIALDLTPGTGRARLFLSGAQKAKERLGASAPVFLQEICGQEISGETAFSAQMHDMADGVICFRHGQTERADWLETAIRTQQVNLIGGGDTPQDTAKLDAFLRAQAEDGLRPATNWHRKEARDEAEPASSTLYPELAPVSYCGVR